MNYFYLIFFLELIYKYFQTLTLKDDPRVNLAFPPVGLHNIV